jgi:exodeoxyribonuclease VII small subunit
MNITFEQAYERLEQILEKMNAGNVPLEDALKLYEEADSLLKLCQEKLTTAEQKIELLIKQRNGELVLDEQGIPQKTPFQPINSSR